MRKLYFVLIIVIVGIFLYWIDDLREIDYSCNVDSDCEIKNVGNHCGYFPLCVNKNFRPHRPELESYICSWPSIDGCKCVENRCRGTLRGKLRLELNL